MNLVALPARPYFKPWWRITREAARVSFHYGAETVVCEGQDAVSLLPRVVEFLDGRHSAEQIAAELPPAVRPLLGEALELFARHGLLLDGPPAGDDGPLEVRDALRFIAATQPGTTAPGQGAAALARLRAGIVGSSLVGAELARVLERLGAVAEPLAWDVPAEAQRFCDVVVAAPAAHELAELPEWNRRALAAGTTWLQVLPFDGSFAAVGPLYIPGETACYECFLHRRAANAADAAQFWAMQDTPAAYPSALPVDVALAGLTGLALLRWHLARDPALPGTFTALTIGGEVALSSHTVYRVPRCRACATVTLTAPVWPWFGEAGPWNG
jgi:bacteriocin biosynthesis cyclodehydratase domain-containing protein